MHVGISLPSPILPKLVSRLHERFYGLAHPAQPAFVSPPLRDIWQKVKAFWKEPLKTKSPVAGLVSFLRLQGHTESGCPSVTPPGEALKALLIPHWTGRTASRKPQPLLVQDRDTLEYF